MTVRWNGAARELPDGETIAGALERLGLPAAHVAVAVNAIFVPRSRHAETPLREGDAVEVLTPHQGG